MDVALLILGMTLYCTMLFTSGVALVLGLCNREPDVALGGFLLLLFMLIVGTVALKTSSAIIIFQGV